MVGNGYNHTVADTLKRAMRNGTAETSPYYAETKDTGNHVRLLHYGTPVCEVKRKKRGEWRLYHIGGYSNSDRNAINTMLQLFGIAGRVSLDKTEKQQNPVWGKFAMIGFSKKDLEPFLMNEL